MENSILIIEDDSELSEMLKSLLKRENYSVTCRHEGKSGLLMAKSGMHFDVILLDVMLPLINGFDVLSTLRNTHVTPVILLTARGHYEDKIFGLELQAYDRSIDMHVSNLRKKLKTCTGFDFIRTIRGCGYSMSKL